MQGLPLSGLPLRMSILSWDRAAFPDQAGFFPGCRHPGGLCLVVKEPASEGFNPRVSTSVVRLFCHWPPEPDKTYGQPAAWTRKSSIRASRGASARHSGFVAPGPASGQRALQADVAHVMEPGLLARRVMQRGAERSKCVCWHLIGWADFTRSAPLDSPPGTSLPRRSLSSPCGLTLYKIFGGASNPTRQKTHRFPVYPKRVDGGKITWVMIHEVL